VGKDDKNGRSRGESRVTEESELTGGGRAAMKPGRERKRRENSGPRKVR